VREPRHGDADKTLMVGRASVEGESRDVATKLKVLARRTISVHKAQDARKVLDAGEVPREGVEACGNAETTDGYASRDDGDTCVEGEGCKVGTERYERGNSPVKPERAAMRSGRRRGRHDPGRARGGARALPALLDTRFFDDGVGA